MNLEATIREAARLELELSTTEDRQLSVKPKSRITPELRNAFREHKAEIIAALLVSDGVSEEVARREAGLPREKPRNIICLSDVQRPPDPYTAEEFEEYVSDLVGKGVSESRARMLAYERLNGRKELPQDLEELEDAYWDAADDGMDEDQFFRRCVGERRTKDLVRLNVIEATDAEALYDNHPDRFDEMDVKSQTTLREWIRRTYEPSDTAYRLDSYAMKHQFERSEVSFYVDNGQFKGAMLAEGFEPVDAHPFPVFNWSFNVVKVREEEDRADLICWEALEPGEPLDLQTWMEEAVKAGVTAEQFVAAVVRLDADGRVVKDADVPLWTTREGAVIWKWVKRGGSRDREKDTDAWCLVILS